MAPRSTPSPTLVSSLAELTGHAESVSGVLALAGGKLLSWSYDKTLRLWSADGAPLATFEGHTDWVYGALELPAGRAASWTGEPVIRVWDTERGLALEPVKAHGRMNRVRALDDGRLLSWGNSEIALWDARSLKRLREFAADGFVEGACVMAPDRLLAWCHDGTLLSWDMKTGKRLVQFVGHKWVVQGAFVLAPGRIVSWAQDKRLHLWDAETGALLAQFGSHRKAVMGARAIDPGRLVSWSLDGTLRLWHVPEGPGRGGKPKAVKPSALVEAHTDRVVDVIRLGEGPLLSYGYDGALKLWSADSLAPAGQLKGHAHRVWDHRWVDPGRLLTWGADSFFLLWSVAEKRALARFEGHTKSIGGVALLPDGRLVSSSTDGTLRLWALPPA
jgi:WD40 repeat protein